MFRNFWDWEIRESIFYWMKLYLMSAWDQVMVGPREEKELTWQLDQLEVGTYRITQQWVNQVFFTLLFKIVLTMEIIFCYICKVCLSTSDNMILHRQLWWWTTCHSTRKKCRKFGQIWVTQNFIFTAIFTIPQSNRKYVCPMEGYIEIFETNKWRWFFRQNTSGIRQNNTGTL